MPFVAKARMHVHRENESACPLPQKEREQRASCEQISAFLQSRSTNLEKGKHHAERPSLDSVAAPAAGGGGAASQGRFHGDPQALRRGRTNVGKLPARCVPPSSLLRRRHPRLPRAQLAAAVGASTRGGPHRGRQWRAAARAGAHALRMELAPIPAVEFRPRLSGQAMPLRPLIGPPPCVKYCVEAHTWQRIFRSIRN